MESILHHANKFFTTELLPVTSFIREKIAYPIIAQILLLLFPLSPVTLFSNSEGRLVIAIHRIRALLYIALFLVYFSCKKRFPTVSKFIYSLLPITIRVKPLIICFYHRKIIFYYLLIHFFYPLIVKFINK